MTKLLVDGRTYEIVRIPLPSWDDYEVFFEGRSIGRVHVLAVGDGSQHRRYTVEGEAGVESIARAAIAAGIILVERSTDVGTTT
ncbi:MAG TPA: hypothetical protein VHE30_06485 [Polyangiaceae bacterium]|nr:hypothetical protein [Polyangiaceae bacterium]